MDGGGRGAVTFNGPADLPDGVGGVPAVHPLQVDGRSPDFPPDDLPFPAAIDRPPDGLLEGEDQADGHVGRL